MRRFSAEAFANRERAAAVLKEHEEILVALERHDAAAASRHMQATSANLLRIHHTQPISQDSPGYRDIALS